MTKSFERIFCAVPGANAEICDPVRQLFPEQPFRPFPRRRVAQSPGRSPSRCRRAYAQEPNPTSQAEPAEGNAITQQNGIYIYKVKVVQHNLDCVNYLHRSGSTTIGFAGTPLLPGAKGDAKVTSERGGITVEANFQGLAPANGFGREYLTYVLWAISPDGRAQNLGEVLPAGTKNNIRVTTALQSFGMIVTAEPYFSVS